MNSLVHARTPFEIVSMSLGNLMALPDPEAAEALNEFMAAMDWVDAAQKMSYGRRMAIIREFEVRSLWRHLIDPRVGVPFANITAWLCSGFLGCERTNKEIHSDLKKLADIPAEKLLLMPKDNIQTLMGLSTSVQREPAIIDAALRLKPAEFDEKIEKEYPGQHKERTDKLYLKLGRSQRKILDAWVEFAVQHDLADNLADAVVKACHMALIDHELDELHPVPDEVVL